MDSPTSDSMVEGTPAHILDDFDFLGTSSPAGDSPLAIDTAESEVFSQNLGFGRVEPLAKTLESPDPEMSIRSDPFKSPEDPQPSVIVDEAPPLSPSLVANDMEHPESFSSSNYHGTTVSTDDLDPKSASDQGESFASHEGTNIHLDSPPVDQVSEDSSSPIPSQQNTNPSPSLTNESLPMSIPEPRMGAGVIIDIEITTGISDPLEVNSADPAALSSANQYSDNVLRITTVPDLDDVPSDSREQPWSSTEVHNEPVSLVSGEEEDGEGYRAPEVLGSDAVQSETVLPMKSRNEEDREHHGKTEVFVSEVVHPKSPTGSIPDDPEQPYSPSEHNSDDTGQSANVPGSYDDSLQSVVAADEDLRSSLYSQSYLPLLSTEHFPPESPSTAPNERTASRIHETTLEDHTLGSNVLSDSHVQEMPKVKLPSDNFSEQDHLRIDSSRDVAVDATVPDPPLQGEIGGVSDPDSSPSTEAVSDIAQLVDQSVQTTPEAEPIQQAVTNLPKVSDGPNLVSEESATEEASDDIPTIQEQASVQSSNTEIQSEHVPNSAGLPAPSERAEPNPTESRPKPNVLTRDSSRTLIEDHPSVTDRMTALPARGRRTSLATIRTTKTKDDDSIPFKHLIVRKVCLKNTKSKSRVEVSIKFPNGTIEQTERYDITSEVVCLSESIIIPKMKCGETIDFTVSITSTTLALFTSTSELQGSLTIESSVMSDPTSIPLKDPKKESKAEGERIEVTLV